MSLVPIPDLATPAAGPWPLTGRDDELGVLLGALAARTPRRVVVVGPAGVGKTRLVRDAQRHTERRGTGTQWLTATRTIGRSPLGIFAPMLPAERPGGGPGASDTFQDLLRRAAQSLVERGGGRPLVLFVDDAHLLDDASASLIRQLVAAESVVAVLTVRSGAPCPEPVTALWTDELAVRLELAQLGEEAVDALLTAALGGQVDRATTADLAERSGGNVLFLRELTLGALADGSIVHDMGVWRLQGPLAPSARTVELVERRLSGLDDRARALLELAAYAEPLGGAELDRLADPELLDRLQREGLLVSALDGRRLEVRLSHPLYGDVLRARTSALRVAAMARSLAESAERFGGRRRDDGLRMGIWRLDGGGGDPATMMRAAWSARWHYDFRLAERLSAAAAGAGAGFEAGLLRAQTTALQGQPEEADRRMATLTGATTTDDERARLATAHIDCLWLCLGRMEDALEVAERARQEITDPVLRDEIVGRRAGVVLGREGPAAAARIAGGLLASARGRSVVWLGLVASYGLGRLGRTADALAAADRGYAAGEQLDVPGDWYPWFNLYARCEALAHAGRFREAETLARAQYRQGLQDGSSEARAWFLWHLCRTARDRGDVRSAERDAREAITLLRRLGRRGFEHSLLSLLASALALGGDHAGAQEALDVAAALGIEPPCWSLTDHLSAQAWTAIAAGSVTAGEERLLRAADEGERIGDRTGAAAALHDVARVGAPERVADRLRALAATIDGDLVAARLEHVEALAEGDAARLDAASSVFDGLGASLLAAEAATDAAAAWRADGRRQRADAALARAGALAEDCPDAHTPALVPVALRERLTEAERGTALLAVAGRTNRQIAEELGLSIRTIDNRLQRTYTKLGISSRAELARLVR